MQERRHSHIRSSLSNHVGIRVGVIVVAHVVDEEVANVREEVIIQDGVAGRHIAGTEGLLFLLPLHIGKKGWGKRERRRKVLEAGYVVPNSKT
jgi:hypothetical protein